MISAFLNPIIVAISLSTAASVLVHDLHIDRVATTVVTPIAQDMSKYIGMSPDLHTHPERHSMLRLLGSRVPGLQPRLENKKHLMQKRTMRGYHPFDNYNLPLV